jgi:hypothetical protein
LEEKIVEIRSENLITDLVEEKIFDLLTKYDDRFTIARVNAKLLYIK